MANSNQDIFLAAPPEAPTLNLAPSSDGGVAEDGLTNDSTPTLNGVTNPGALVRIFDGSAQVAQVTAALDGTYSVTLGALANGAHALTATATLAGQTSAASELLSLMIDTVAPQARFELVGRSGSRFDFDLVFSEAPAGLSINDIVGESFRGAPQVVGFAATNDPHVYRVSLGSDFIPGEMENTIRLGAGSYADAAGNPGGSASYRVTHLTYVEQNERPVAPEVVDGVTVGKVKQTTFTGPQETTYFPLLSQLLNLPLPGGGGVQLGGGLAGALTTLDVTLTPGLIPPGSGLQGVHDAATQTLLNILGGFAGGAGMPLHEFLGPLSSLPPLFAGQLGALPPLAPLTSPFTGVNLQLTSNPLSSALQPAIIQGANDHAMALLLDTTGLPPGNSILLNGLTFGIVTGDAVIGGGAGRQVLFGDKHAQSMVLGEGDDELHGGGGNDTVGSAEGDDRLFGDDGADRVFGGAGDDFVHGNAGADTVSGDAGRDTVQGGKGDDSLSGGAGDDRLLGDLGDDTVSGGAGADLFVGLVGGGRDLVLDFSFAEGDRLLLGATRYTAHQSGADTAVDLDGGGQLVLANVQLSTLPAGWIV